MIETAYDAVVFDNDGVLIEPTDRERLVEAVRRSFEEFDVTAAEAVVTSAADEADLTLSVDPTHEFPDLRSLVDALLATPAT